MAMDTLASAPLVGGSRRGVVRIACCALALATLVVAFAILLEQVRDTVLLSSPEVRQAQARQSVAEANYRTAELARQTRAANAQAASEAAWQPWLTGAGRLALLALLVAVPVALAAAMVGVVFLFRRHISLPTSDGRVPLVGLDRELSREALFRYQALRGGGTAFQALPVDRQEFGPLVDDAESGQVEFGGQLDG